MADSPADGRFRCTPSAHRRAGRRRLALLLVALALAAVAAAGMAWAGGRLVPALLAAAVATVPLFAWRMSGDLDPLALWIAAGQLTVHTRRHLLRWPVAGAVGRRLADDEIAHLARLTASAGFLTSAGGFDSHRLGEFELYASDLAHAVLVEIGEERLVLTPDDPEGFLRALAAQAPASGP